MNYIDLKKFLKVLHSNNSYGGSFSDYYIRLYYSYSFENVIALHLSNLYEFLLQKCKQPTNERKQSEPNQSDKKIFVLLALGHIISIEISTRISFFSKSVLTTATCPKWWFLDAFIDFCILLFTTSDDEPSEAWSVSLPFELFFTIDCFVSMLSPMFYLSLSVRWGIVLPQKTEFKQVLKSMYIRMKFGLGETIDILNRNSQAPELHGSIKGIVGLEWSSKTIFKTLSFVILHIFYT